MALRKKHKDKITEAFTNPERITKALTQGVRNALLQHKQAGNPIIIWRDGKSIWIKAEDIPIEK
jgi:hypothetical protein